MLKDKDLIPGKWYSVMSGSTKHVLKFNNLSDGYVNSAYYLNNNKFNLGGSFSKNTYNFEEVHPREINQYLPADKQERVELPIFN